MLQRVFRCVLLLAIGLVLTTACTIEDPLLDTTKTGAGLNARIIEKVDVIADD